MNAKIATTALTLTAALAASTVAPAKADGAASTRNIILGAAALVAGIAVESNVASKNRAANTVEGYLPDGSVVYQDGHVVTPNGQSYYPGNEGQQVSCNGQSCWISNDGGQAAYTQGRYRRAYGNRVRYGTVAFNRSGGG